MPLNNNITQTQTPGYINYIIQSDAPIYQAKFENYRNISEIPHKGIKEIDENTFYISVKCCSKFYLFSFFFSGGLGELIFCLIDSIIKQKIHDYCLLIFLHGSLFALFGYFCLHSSCCF